jgi:outer membrane protein OmpA-like peptidoglycan-associated protein
LRRREYQTLHLRSTASAGQIAATTRTTKSGGPIREDRLNKPAALLFVLFTAACASEQHYALEAPPLPPPVKTRPVHAHPLPARPPEVGSAGPLKMAMVGSYMDAQERDFRARLRGEGVTVVRVGDDIVVGARDDALFSGEQLSGRGKSVVERVAELVRHYEHSSVQVAGFMDASGTPSETYELSGNRAKAIANALIADGVVQDRVSSQGFGASHPKFMVGANAKEPRNRRIEIHVVAHPTA